MDRLSAGRGEKGSEHKEAYVRFHALVAAIVRIVQSRNIEQTEMGWFLTGARKKSLEGILRILGYDQSLMEP